MKDTDTILRKFLDGELSGEEEREALHRIAESEEMRSMLRFERSLATLQADRDSMPAMEANVPEGFSEGVMQAVARLEDVKKTERARKQDEAPGNRIEENDEERILDRLSRVLERMITPAQFTVRPAWMALMILIAAGGWWILPLTESEPVVASFSENRTDPATAGAESMATRVVAEEGEEVWIRFVYIDEDADHIAVAGDFTEWTPMELERERVGEQLVWTGMVRVPRGEHHYMFIRNGQEWVTDPFADVRRDDGFGNQNAVLYL